MPIHIDFTVPGAVHVSVFLKSDVSTYICQNLGFASD
jgi:hypothetical protein